MYARSGAMTASISIHRPCPPSAGISEDPLRPGASSPESARCSEVTSHVGRRREQVRAGLATVDPAGSPTLARVLPVTGEDRGMGSPDRSRGRGRRDSGGRWIGPGHGSGSIAGARPGEGGGRRRAEAVARRYRVEDGAERSASRRISRVPRGGNAAVAPADTGETGRSTGALGVLDAGLILGGRSARMVPRSPRWRTNHGAGER